MEYSEAPWEGRMEGSPSPSTNISGFLSFFHFTPESFRQQLFIFQLPYLFYFSASLSFQLGLTNWRCKVTVSETN